VSKPSADGDSARFSAISRPSRTDPRTHSASESRYHHNRLFYMIFLRKSGKKEPAISRVLSWTIIHLGQLSPTASSDLPGSLLRHAVQDEPAYSPIWSCFGRGLPCRDVLPLARCALTAPFHPCRHTEPGPKPADPMRLGGIFSVALSMGLHPPGVTWRPAIRSPDFPLPPLWHGAAIALLTLTFLTREW